MMEVVIEESEAEGRAAREFLEDVRQSFPQVIQDSIACHITKFVHADFFLFCAPF